MGLPKVFLWRGSSLPPPPPLFPHIPSKGKTNRVADERVLGTGNCKGNRDKSGVGVWGCPPSPGGKGKASPLCLGCSHLGVPRV